MSSPNQAIKQTKAIFKSPISSKVERSQYLSQFGSEKNLLTDGMISGDLLRTNFLRPCSLYFSPSSKFSSTPAALFSLITLIAYQNLDLLNHCKLTMNYTNAHGSIVSILQNQKMLIHSSLIKYYQFTKIEAYCEPNIREDLIACQFDSLEQIYKDCIIKAL